MKLFKFTTPTLHECEINTPHFSYGCAIDYCREDEQGRFWVGNGEYSSQVKFCPECGTKAPNIDLTPDPEPKLEPFVCKCKPGISRILSDCWHTDMKSTLEKK